MEDNREKITILSKKDLDISYFVGPGKGGQAKQRTNSGVNIFHRDSGAAGRCSESRVQSENKKKAFLNLTKSAKFKVWLNKKLHEIREGEKLEQSIEKELAPDKLKFEIKENGKWIEVKNDYFDSEIAKIEN